MTFLTLDKPFTIIAAIDEKGGIGKNGLLPWVCPADMQFFRNVTTKTTRPGTINAVIMGRLTWESLKRPLPNRLNIVITSRPQEITTDYSVYAFRSLHEAHMYLKERGDTETEFIIGGAAIYQEVIKNNWSQTMYLSRIPGHYDCDTFFPDIPSYWRVSHMDGSYIKYHNYYTRHLEQQYMSHMRSLIHSNPINGRNGLVYSGFNWFWSADLADGLPLFSTRQSFWKGICKELLFFISGATDSKILERDGIRIWEGNTSIEFLESRDLRKDGQGYERGDMGPMYGWMWRHYGAQYHGMDYNYTGQGFDQLRDVVHKLLHDPHNRRILLTTYDPSKVEQSVLAPCHGIVNQFYVRDVQEDRILDMYTYQRSADMFLGVNFNIPSHATLLMIIAMATGMKPGKLYYGFGDTHVYAEHMDALNTLLKRTPNDVFPTLDITAPPPHAPDTDTAIQWIESLTYEDFTVNGYNPQPAIKAPMVA